MKRSPVWREFESGDSILLQALRFAILAGGVLFLGFSGVLPLSWQLQSVLALVTVLAALWMNHGSDSHLVTLTLVLLSVYSTFRYAFWRVTTVAEFFRGPGARWAPLDAIFVGLLLLAECYSFMVLGLGYLQVLWPLRRSPVPLPDDPQEWPAIDLLIPTYDEPLSLVRFTALAAINIDWPAEKLHIYLLDDGGREEFRAFAEEAGIGYIARKSNEHAKAGNINHALREMDSPFVVIFDCDHVPTRSFLQLTMGWLLRDQNLAMLQTPHHLYSPDPYERNLDQFRTVPGEDELFYGVVQDGNDFWNATCFCGSCAVLRRSALEEVGGMAVETVTEDAHTSLRLQRRGWNTAYINIPQAAGLATERLSAHVRQRIRWARGMVQILRIENPLVASGLKPAQRLCYFNAMSHFLFALPRMVFLTAPLIYLIFGRLSLPGYWAAIIAYAAPHLVLSSLAHSRIHGKHRHSFWNEIYETVLAPYILLPTLAALIYPKWHKFDVTAKGGVVDRSFFDARIARPYLLLLAFNLFGLLCVVARLVHIRAFAVASWMAFVNWPARLYDGGHAGAIWVNALWALFNVLLLGVATAVAWESQQRREAVRVSIAVPSDVILPDGSMIQGVTSDLSIGGVRTHLDEAAKAKPGDRIQFVFPLLDGSATLPAVVVDLAHGDLRAKFNGLNLQEDEALTMLLYSRADAWLGWRSGRETDRPLRSMARILKLSMRGLAMALGSNRGGTDSPKTRLVTSIAPIFFLTLLAGMTGDTRAAAQPAGGAGATLVIAPPAGTFDTVFTLRETGAGEAIELHGVQASRTLTFLVSRSRLVKAATLKLHYAFSPGLLLGVSQLNVSLNGTLVATLPVSTAGQGKLLEASIALPAELLVHENQLGFEFIGHYAAECEDPANSTLWSRVDANSTVELSGSLVPLANDLSVLPLPFYDSGMNPRPQVPIVFLTQPSAKAMQAAGILASWLGILNGDRPVRFPVSIGTIPTGDAIVIAQGDGAIAESLKINVLSGSAVALRPNPNDANSKVLVVSGRSGDEVLTAASALALHGETWQGSQVAIRNFTAPPPRGVDDAPRWLAIDRITNVGQLVKIATDLQSDGSRDVVVNLQLPPDLDFGNRRNLPFHLDYRYSSDSIASGSTLQMFLNGSFVSATPMPHMEKASPVLETLVPVPVDDLRPSANLFTFKFLFQRARTGQCGMGAPAGLEGAILKDSYLDLTGIAHSARLPNLQLFSRAGFPFTRRADLSDTAVVLPDKPTTPELEMFLALMGHFGAVTGYPALNVTITGPAGMSHDGKKDYLVIGTIGDQWALKLLDAAMPVAFNADGLRLRDSHGFLDRLAPWRDSGINDAQGAQLATSGSLPDALVEELEWPAGSHKSAVVAVVRSDEAIPAFLTAFLDGPQVPNVAHSVSVLHGTQFASCAIGEGGYQVEEGSAMELAISALEQFPWMIAVLTVIFCFLIAVLVQAWLRRHARTRLQGSE